MRDLFLIFSMAAGLCASIVYPFAGVLLWAWLSLASPHTQAFGFARTLPINMVIAAVALLGWLFSRERKLPANDALIWLSGIFLLWCTLNGFAAVDPDWSWPYWDRTWKIFALGFLVAVQAQTKAKIHALTWIVVISLFYYGVKGGIFTLISGGGAHVYGPQGTIIGDNNQLALALLMVLPMANYLRVHSAHRWVRLGLLAGMAISLVAVLGTYSRGGFVGLAVLLLAACLRGKNRLAFAAAAGLVLVPAIYFMPDTFYDRLHSINFYSSDGSFQGRVMAWHVAYDYARDHFPFGAGFYGTQLSSVFHTYYPGEIPRAAHSIYFQVLGEQGFIGLVLYLMLLATAFIKSLLLSRAGQRDSETVWISEMSNMIFLSLLVFCLSGAALSMAYYDAFIVYMGMLLAMGRIIQPARQERMALGDFKLGLRRSLEPG